MNEAKDMAAKMHGLPGFALETTKKLVNEGINIDLQAALANEERCFAFLFSTQDQKEGMKAFVEKRKPVFKGK